MSNEFFFYIKERCNKARKYKIKVTQGTSTLGMVISSLQLTSACKLIA